MNDETLESRLKAAVEKMTPNRFDSVQKACEERKGTVVFVPQEKKKHTSWTKIVAAILVIAVLAGGGFGVFQYQMANAVDAIVSLDVNPSIELSVNKKNKVVSAKALNDDATGILGNMNLKGTDVDVAVNALIGAMVSSGYIDDLANSILISVEGEEARSLALEELITKTVSSLLTGEGALQPAIVSQTVTEDAALQEMADTYGISLGRAQLINAILEKDPTKTFEDLAALTVNELNLLAASKQATTQDFTTTGTASQKAYIGEAKAEEIALTAAKLSRNQLTYLHTKLDWDDGTIVYEVEFLAGNTEYDYDIDALTGAVVKSGKETFGTAGSSSNGTSGASITMEQAKQIALKDAGVSESQVTFRKQKLDSDDGWLFYELEFLCGNTEYEYDINAATGAIAGKDVETHRTSSNTGSGTGSTSSKPNGSVGGTTGNQPSGTAVTLEQAKQIALKDAGVSSSQASFIKEKSDYDDGRQLFELEFVAGNSKYEYEVNATDGSIIKRDMETYASSNGSGSSQGGLISRDAARDAALSHAGYTSSEVSALEIEQDRDDGRTVYEVSFRVGRQEFDYEIDASNGAILKAENEYDD